MKKNISLIFFIFLFLFTHHSAQAESPWAKNETYGSKVAGKFMYGIKNAGFWWLQPFKEAKSECYGSEWEGFTYGMGQGVHYMVSGLVQLATFPIPVDFPDAGTGLTEVPRKCGKKKTSAAPKKDETKMDEFVRVREDEEVEEDTTPVSKPKPPVASKPAMTKPTPAPVAKDKDDAITKALTMAQKSEPREQLPPPTKATPRTEPIDWETDFEPETQETKKTPVTAAKTVMEKKTTETMMRSTETVTTTQQKTTPTSRSLTIPKPPAPVKVTKAPRPASIPSTIRRNTSAIMEKKTTSPAKPVAETMGTQTEPTLQVEDIAPTEPEEAIFKTDDLTAEEQAELDAAFLKLFEEAEELPT